MGGGWYKLLKNCKFELDWREK